MCMQAFEIEKTRVLKKKFNISQQVHVQATERELEIQFQSWVNKPNLFLRKVWAYYRVLLGLLFAFGLVFLWVLACLAVNLDCILWTVVVPTPVITMPVIFDVFVLVFDNVFLQVYG